MSIFSQGVAVGLGYFGLSALFSESDIDIEGFKKLLHD